jgi:uncharacterized protein (TIGR03089 family)
VSNGHTTPPATVPEAFAAAVADPARPLVTWYDDATGSRVELSGATLGNWLAKTANLLTEGCGLGRGDTALVDAPPHWQTGAVLLGCWAAGLRVHVGAAPAAGPSPAVVFAAAGRVGRYAGGPSEVYGLALDPLGGPMPDPPPGVWDYVTEVRGYGDRYDPVATVLPDDPATHLTHAQLCRSAADRAAANGVTPGARVLIDVDACPDPLDWLLAPLVVGAHAVLCTRLDAAALPARLAAERVDVTVGVAARP